MYIYMHSIAVLTIATSDCGIEQRFLELRDHDNLKYRMLIF